MEIFNVAITRLFDYLFFPFNAFPPVVSLSLFSAIVGIVFLKLFGLFSNQEQIRSVKNTIKAHLLAVVIYRNDIITSLNAQKNMFRANFTYIAKVIIPFLILFVLVLPILSQLNLRYGYRPFLVGENLRVSVTVDDKRLLEEISLITDNGLRILTPPLRIAEKNEIDWKLEARQSGDHMISVISHDGVITKEVVVDSNTGKLSPLRSKGMISSILYPGEKPLPKESRINAVKVSYPSHHIRIGGHKFHWLLVFSVVSIVSGLLVMRVLKVEI